MRLIDATALERNVLEWMPSDPCGREEKERPLETDIVVSLMMEIEEAPTIDINRPQGEWIDVSGGWSANEECSLCGEIVHEYNYNYCPNCGAKMRGKKHDV